MILIKNADLFGKKTDILISGDRITAIGSLKDAKADTVIDATGLTALPAFVDMHTHLREPGFEGKETIATGAAAAAAGGYAAICAMPNTNPVIDNKYLVNYVRTKGEAAGKVRVYPIGAITQGQRGEQLAEMGKMLAEGAIAFSDDGKPVSDARLMRLALEYAKPLRFLLISHAEDLSLTDGGFANEGYNATVTGLKGIPNAAEEVMIARDLILAESFGGMLHIAHVSTAGSVELIRQAKKRGVSVTAETCPHYIALTDEAILDFDTDAKVNPPLRTEADRLAVIEGLKDGTIDCIATDHAPHTALEKDATFAEAPFGISGIETAYAVCYTELVRKNHISLSALTTLMSTRPAQILDIQHSLLTEYSLADIVLVDNNASYTIDPSKFVSKGKNTPFKGKAVYGKIALTICDGKIIYKNDEYFK